MSNVHRYFRQFIKFISPIHPRTRANSGASRLPTPRRSSRYAWTLRWRTCREPDNSYFSSSVTGPAVCFPSFRRSSRGEGDRSESSAALR